MLSYVLITPARNEAEFIGLTIQSVVAQTVLPRKWVIVSDGSTDGTDDIVTGYAARYPWIELVRTAERKERHFSGKVRAFEAGYERMQGLEYDVIASLDGDISFQENYFEFLLEKLANDDQLGLVGTPFRDRGAPVYDYRFVSIEHVSGACQVFRRECFEQIGGYVPMKGGGIDFVAVISSRMKGWKTRTFPEMICDHHRPMGTAEHGVLSARFRIGVKDYRLGGHPLWQLFRTAYQASKPPFLIGGLAIGAGYFWSMLKRIERPVPQELIAFRRSEEMRRLKSFLGMRPGPVPVALRAGGK